MRRGGEISATLSYVWRYPALRRAAYFALAALATALAVALVWWLPASRQTSALEADIASRRAAMVESARMGQIVMAQREAERDIARLEKKLHTGASQADLVQAIARLANAHGVRVLAQSFDQGKGAQDGALYLELGLGGSYAGLRGMMADLAGLPVWAEIVDATIERNSGAAAPLRAQLRLLTYRGERASR